MDAATLVKAMPGLDLARATQLVNGCNSAMVIGEINNVKRCAMFLAQIGCESASLRYKQEIQPPPNATYPPYIGRTFIQVTWQSNYQDFGNWCKRKNLLTDANLFVNNPPTLAADQWAWLGPIWYWTVARPQLNSLADDGDLIGCTRAINGGLNGLDDRRDRYNRCLKLGNAILPTNIPTPVDEDKPAQLVLSRSTPLAIKAGKWSTVSWSSWSPKSASGGTSAVLRGKDGMFAQTLDLTLSGLGAADNLYVRIQVTDRTGAQRALYPIAELRGTTGSSGLSYTRVGSVAASSNLQVLVSSSVDASLTSAQWRVFDW